MELIEGNGIQHVLVMDQGRVLGVVDRDNVRRYARSHAKVRP